MTSSLLTTRTPTIYTFTTPPTPRPPLPTEILLLIINDLPLSTLISLSLTNHFFHSLLHPTTSALNLSIPIGLQALDPISEMQQHILGKLGEPDSLNKRYINVRQITFVVHRWDVKKIRETVELEAKHWNFDLLGVLMMFPHLERIAVDTSQAKILPAVKGFSLGTGVGSRGYRVAVVGMVVWFFRAFPRGNVNGVGMLRVRVPGGKVEVKREVTADSLVGVFPGSRFWPRLVGTSLGVPVLVDGGEVNEEAGEMVFRFEREGRRECGTGGVLGRLRNGLVGACGCHYKLALMVTGKHYWWNKPDRIRLSRLNLEGVRLEDGIRLEIGGRERDENGQMNSQIVELLWRQRETLAELVLKDVVLVGTKKSGQRPIVEGTPIRWKDVFQQLEPWIFPYLGMCRLEELIDVGPTKIVSKENLKVWGNMMLNSRFLNHEEA